MSSSTKIKPGIYRHYKGGKYKVHLIARHSETQEELVVYETLYENPISQWWARPAQMFTEIVEKDGEKIPRFRFIKN